MPLAVEGQNDFGAGSQLEVAAHLIATNGFRNCENALLDDDGSAYKRGGSVKFGAAAFGTHGKAVWEGIMGPGRRTVVACETDFGVTATEAKGTAIVNLGGPGFPQLPGTFTYFQHMLFISGGTIYGGSRKAADYGTGTIAVTQGSAVVKGSGTAWLANVDAGMLFRVAIAGSRMYVVKEVLSNTELVLAEGYENSGASGVAYTLKRLEEASAPYKSVQHYAVAGERLICMEGNRIDFSEPNKPHLYEAVIFPQETHVQNVHELPEGIKILGGFTTGVDKLIACHTGGITSISNMAKSIVDGLGNSQHRIDVYSRDVVLWGTGAGIAATGSTFIVPAVDNVYLVDGISAPKPLADAVLPRYRELLLEGLTPGGSWVTREQFFLPIVNASGIAEDLLICRLDKPFSFRNKTVYPWTFGAGAGALIGGAAVRHPREGADVPRVLGMAADGTFVELLSYFFPEEVNAFEHDGSVHQFTLLTRDIGVGDEAIHRWRKIQLFYEMSPEAMGEDPRLSCEVGTGITEAGLPLWDEVDWDEFEWAVADDGQFRLLEGSAPPNAGLSGQFAQNEKTWLDNTRSRYVRYRFSSADPVSKLVLRGFMAFPASAGNRHSRVS